MGNSRRGWFKHPKYWTREMYYGRDLIPIKEFCEKYHVTWHQVTHRIRSRQGEPIDWQICRGRWYIRDQPIPGFTSNPNQSSD